MTFAENREPGARFGEAWERLFDPPIAHRGLWSPDGAPENSLAAFQAACSHGYGIELDVQLSADGEAMVFHDTRLTRMTGAEGRMSDHSAADLGKLKLGKSDEVIPTLADTLTMVGHRAMVLIELKTPAGEVGVESLAVGDVVVTKGSAEPRKITWIGKGQVLATRGQRGPATPVIVRKGALGPNVPNRDLHVT